MIKIETLTTEELKLICSKIPPSVLRQYFQKNPKAFAEIKSGFRPEKLSDSDAFSLLFKNANKPFIAAFIEIAVSKWLAEIQENKKRIVEEGYSEEEALLLTIPESVFRDNCEVYFKLIEQTPDENYIRLFRESMLLRQKEAGSKASAGYREKVQESDSLLDEANKTISVLKEQLSNSQTTESDLRGELAVAKGQLKAKDEELCSLKTTIQDSEELKQKMLAELEHYKQLTSFSDEYDQEKESEFQHISIGQIYHDHSGQPWINRLADIVDGEIVPFVSDDTIPHFFSNRDRLFWKDGPEGEGAIGVWSWRAEPSHSDPTKDYVTSKYNRYFNYIEVVILHQCKSLPEVAALLADWIEKDFSGEKILFVYTAASGTTEGLLCSVKNMQIVGDKARLLTSVFMLPHYAVQQSDIIRVGEILVYRKMSLGIPNSIYRVRTPYDVVKKILLSRITISALRENGLTKKEAQKCKLFLESIPTGTLIQDVSDAYACTETEAKSYIDEFIEHVDTYLSEKDLDINIVSTALARDEGLIAQCKAILTEEWEKENSVRMEEAQKNLTDTMQIEKEICQKNDELNKQMEALEGELQQEQRKIAETKKLADDVEKKVAERIKGAQQDAADFISQMAFFSSLINSGKVDEVHRESSAIPVYRSVMNYIKAGKVDDIDTFEEELTDNLVAIGYSEETAVEMAQAISFSICSRMPIVISMNSTAIAQCIAATIGGEELTEVFVGNQQTVIGSLRELIGANETGHPFVYLVHGVFDGYSNTVFNEITNIVHNSITSVVVIVSIQGISHNMVPDVVWSSAFFIDGDSGIQRIGTKPVNAVDLEMGFEREMEETEYRTRWKELQPFSSVLSNMQICLYARYLASYGIGLQDSPTILNQIIAVSRSSGLVEKLLALFRENGISNGEKMIEQIM